MCVKVALPPKKIVGCSTGAKSALMSTWCLRATNARKSWLNSSPRLKIRRSRRAGFSSISATNGGVWKRFEFAAEIAKSPYVCLFDDDTIPGARWLENCHMNMMQQRGVYVTNSRLVRNFKDYRDNWLVAGWCVPNKKTCAVDGLWRAFVVL